MHGSTGSEALASHLLHLSVLQLVTRSSPFTHSRTLPLYTLSDLLADYLGLLAKSAKDAAELSGRDKVSVWDVGKALEEFGLGDINDMKEELESGMNIEREEGVEDENDRLRELAGGLRELMEPQQIVQPYLQISYVPLQDHEISLIETNPEALYDEGDSYSTDSDSELRSLTPSSPQPFIKEEDAYLEAFEHTLNMIGVEEPMGGSSWRDPNQIPFYVNDFLPPFPGMERERNVPEAVRRKREKERERDAAAEAWAGSSNSSDPWITTLPLASSSYAGLSTASLTQPLSPPGSPSATGTRRRRPRSLSPQSTSTSSLPFYNSVSREIRHTPLWPRPNPKRRLAASKISVSADMTLSIDSLFGSLPVPPTRSASLTSGFLPDFAPSKIHPFNTSLPHTIAGPALIHPSPHAPLAAPLPHPRIPSIIGSIAQPFSVPTSPHLTLFTRLTRLGPPAPLGPKGESLEYEYVAGTGIVSVNVEWAERAHNLKLPRGIREKGDGSNISGIGNTEGELGGSSMSTGIKLNLGGGKPSRAGSAVVESPGVFYGYGTTPGATPGASGETPGPSGYNWGLETLEEGTPGLGEMLPPSLPMNDFSSYSISYEQPHAGTNLSFLDELPPISTFDANSMDIDALSTFDPNSVDIDALIASTYSNNPNLPYNPFFPPPIPTIQSSSQDQFIPSDSDISALLAASIGTSLENSDQLPSSSPQPEELDAGSSSLLEGHRSSTHEQIDRVMAQEEEEEQENDADLFNPVASSLSTPSQAPAASFEQMQSESAEREVPEVEEVEELEGFDPEEEEEEESMRTYEQDSSQLEQSNTVEDSYSLPGPLSTQEEVVKDEYEIADAL